MSIFDDIVKDEEKIDSLLRMIHKKCSYIKGYHIEEYGYFLDPKSEPENVTIIIVVDDCPILLEPLMDKLSAIFKNKYKFNFTHKDLGKVFSYFGMGNVIWFDDNV